MRTRSSRAASSVGVGARTCTAAAGVATGVGCAAARSIAASMSPLLTRPSLPVPATLAASMPDSAASLRTDGASGASADLAAGAACRGGAGCGCEGVGEVAAGAAFAAGATPSLIWPRSVPTATVSPSLASISASTPAAGAGTSIVTLSVSSSTSGSSTATASPGFLNHLPMVASVTDSPSAGTRISAMLRQCLVQNFAELCQMQRHLSDSGRSGSGTADITGAPILGADLIEHPFQEYIDEDPGAHIARFFLAPDDFGRLKARQFRHQRLGREWIELFDP